MIKRALLLALAVLALALFAVLRPGATDVEHLAPPGAELVVSGRVLDDEREPVAGVHLDLYSPARVAATSDELGRFEFRGIPSTDQASISAQSIHGSRQQIMPKSLDLGPLRASRFDIEFEVQSAIEVGVYAEMPDGTELPAGSFDVDWADGRLRNVGLLEPPLSLGNAQSRWVLRGAELELRVAARSAAMPDRLAILRGSASVRTGAGTPSQLEVRIRLGETGRLEIPDAPAGAGILELDEDSELRGALDVQVLDRETGQPIEGENEIVFYLHPARPEHRWITPGPGGWVRIWQRIGTRDAFAHVHGRATERVTLSIPRSGHGRAEWRL